MKSKKAKMR